MGDNRTSVTSMKTHLLIDGYRAIACSGEGVPDGDDDTCAISAVTCRECLHHGFKMYEALTEAIATRLVEIGKTKL